MHLKKIVNKNFILQEKFQPNQKSKIYKCKFCTKTYAHHVTRMGNHLMKLCLNCPSSVKNLVKHTVNTTRAKKKKHRRSDDSSDSESEGESFCPEESSDHNLESGSRILQNLTLNINEQPGISGSRETGAQDHTKKQLNTPSIKNFCDKMSRSEESRLHALLATAIYTSGTPLTITTNPRWQEFFSALRPSFNLPTRGAISNALLEASYSKVKIEVNEKVQSASTVGLQCDGWSNVRNEGIINFVVTTPDPVFFKTVSTSSNKQTGQYIAQQMSEVVDAIGAEKVLGVCTDNAAAMKSAWNILGDLYSDQKIAFYGCAAHILNLLVKDVMAQPSIDTLVKNAIAIVREIKDKHVMAALFAEIQQKDSNNVKTSLKFPVKTRFGSLIFCLQSLLENKHNLQALAISPKADPYWKNLSKSVILGADFWIRALKVLTLLQPIGKWIATLEGDKPKLSLVPKAFQELRDHFVHELQQSSLSVLSSVETTKVFAAFDKREKMALCPIHYAANILDPSFKGKHLSENGKTEGTALIFKLSKKFKVNQDRALEEITEYHTETGIWSQEYVKRAMVVTSAENWWKAICNTTVLSKIAAAILSLPATSAATERSFSTYGWIHNSKRNRLSIERAGMITYIAHNLKLLCPKNNKSSRNAKENDDPGESEAEDNSTEEDAEQTVNEEEDTLQYKEIDAIYGRGGASEEEILYEDVEMLDEINAPNIGE